MLLYIFPVSLFLLLGLELTLFVKIIVRYRKRYIPALTILAIFAFNLLLIYALLYSSVLGVAHARLIQRQPSRISSPVSSSIPPS